LIQNPVFAADVLFIRSKNRVGARSAQWSFSDIDRRRRIRRVPADELQRPHLRGRRPVRVLSAISDKSNPVDLETSG